MPTNWRTSGVGYARHRAFGKRPRVLLGALGAGRGLGLNAAESPQRKIRGGCGYRSLQPSGSQRSMPGCESRCLTTNGGSVRSSAPPAQFCGPIGLRQVMAHGPHGRPLRRRGVANKTGAALVEHIRSAPFECVNRLFRTRREASASPLTYAEHDRCRNGGRPPRHRLRLHQRHHLTALFAFLRAGFFVVFYEPDDLDWSGHTEAIERAAVAALDAFVDNPHFFDETGNTLVS